MMNTNATKSPGFAAAMKATFGREGETTLDFGKQLKALSDEDKIVYSGYLTDAGIAHEPPAVKIAVAA